MDILIIIIIIIIIGVFAIGLIVILVVGFVLLDVISVSSKVNNTNNDMIAPALTAWFIPNFFGWIFVREGEQVGVIGSRVFRSSSAFTYSPFNPVRMYIVSLQERTETISIDGTTRDGSKINLTAHIKYQVLPEHVYEIIRRDDNPYNAFQQSLKTTVESYVGETMFEVLYNSSLQTSQGLKTKIKDRLPEYKVNVEGLKLTGEKVNQHDILAQQEERIAIAKLEAELNTIKGEPKLQRIIIKKMMDVYGAGVIAGAGNADLSLLLEWVSNFRTHSYPLIENYDPAPRPTLPDGSLNMFIRPPLHLVSETPPQHQLECNSYQIAINTRNFPENVSVEIRNPVGSVVFKEEMASMSLEEILTSVSSFIENDLQGG